MLVNNLGIFEPKTFEAITDADWLRQIPAEMIHYGMTKAAQLAVARGLAETLAGTGVTVNSVLPGPTASEGVGDFCDAPRTIPRRRCGHGRICLQCSGIRDHGGGAAG